MGRTSIVAVIMLIMGLAASANAKSECPDKADQDTVVTAIDVVDAAAAHDETVALTEELRKTRQGIGGWDAPFQENPPIRDGVDTVFVFSTESGLRPYLINYYDRPAQLRLRGQWYPVTISEDGTWSVTGLTHQLGSAQPASAEEIARDTSTPLVGYVRTEKGRLFLVAIPYF